MKPWDCPFPIELGGSLSTISYHLSQLLSCQLPEEAVCRGSRNRNSKRGGQLYILILSLVTTDKQQQKNTGSWASTSYHLSQLSGLSVTRGSSLFIFTLKWFTKWFCESQWDLTKGILLKIVVAVSTTVAPVRTNAYVVLSGTNEDSSILFLFAHHGYHTALRTTGEITGCKRGFCTSKQQRLLSHFHTTGK